MDTQRDPGAHSARKFPAAGTKKYETNHVGAAPNHLKENAKATLLAQRVGVVQARTERLEYVIRCGGAGQCGGYSQGCIVFANPEIAENQGGGHSSHCLLYTSDAADE